MRKILFIALLFGTVTLSGCSLLDSNNRDNIDTELAACKADAECNAWYRARVEEELQDSVTIQDILERLDDAELRLDLIEQRVADIETELEVIKQSNLDDFTNGEQYITAQFVAFRFEDTDLIEEYRVILRFEYAAYRNLLFNETHDTIQAPTDLELVEINATMESLQAEINTYIDSLNLGTEVTFDVEVVDIPENQ